MKNTLLLICLTLTLTLNAKKKSTIKIIKTVDSPLIEFGITEVEKSYTKQHLNNLTVNIHLNPALEPQDYVIDCGKKTEVSGGSPIGIMYGLLELAEQINLTQNIDELKSKKGTSFIKNRGIKFNIPLDARTPSYDDTGDAALKNINEMWNMEFWTAFFDDMARYRYNTLTLWNPHPFPSMIKLDEYPEIALNDVCVPSIKPVHKEGVWGDPMNLSKIVADNLKVVREISIDDKIKFWQDVMTYAKNRGIKIYFITWNINLNSVAPPSETRYFGQKQKLGNVGGKYQINNDQDNEKGIKYLRACVKEFILTYPDLAGIGVTPSENMEDRDDEYDREKWLAKTYAQGVKDAKEIQPDRNIEMIHRVWLSGMDKIENDFAPHYPDSLTLSFKYAKARLYSSTKPPFANKYIEVLKEKGWKSWWNLRNDDIFHLRWGDPDYVREFLANLPPEQITAGYHMGSDGYVWGREHIDKNEALAGKLEIEKHWFKFMLWGRLGYNNTLSNKHFEKVLGTKFPSLDEQKLLKAWQTSSKIVPLVNQFHWRDWDYHWAVEGCIDCRKGFNTVYDFIHCPTMEASGILTIPEFVNKSIQLKTITGITPIQWADSLEHYSKQTLAIINHLNTVSGDKEMQATIDDIESFAHLGNYYAAKIRAGIVLQFNIQSHPQKGKPASVFLKEGLEHWKQYAEIMSANYKPQMLARTRVMDWNKITEDVKADIALAELIENNQWTSLFNGKDLNGWHVKTMKEDAQKEYFKVDNGAILANSVGDKEHEYMWLMSDSTYNDFILRLEYKICKGAKGNSGIQFRSNYDEKANWLDGPQVDISPEPIWRCGMIWDETRDNKRWLYPNLPIGEWVNESMATPDYFLKTEENPETWGPWNRMTIVANGTRIKVYINDLLTTDYDGTGILDDDTHTKYNVGMNGKIALQIHRKNEVKVAFKNICISEIDSK
ncbi:3-keto-disaccharide hydrolase [Labilibacter marinus]|uniref:3-keto-disaccharide hydrolase n=1 Tax=Labilibacter marinus TaxID=1477105 RepID=UPI00083737F7|nr:DUF1080 domain-containing protein [Labilibacter marinus]